MTLGRKTARLPGQNYFGHNIYSITIVCAKRQVHLAEPHEARRLIAILLESATRHRFKLHAYCVMSDHFHILAEGTLVSSDLREFIRVVKQRSAFEFRKTHGCALWEMSYYDRILRPKESIETVAAYILQNPVRWELCSTAAEFPFSGSQTITWFAPPQSQRHGSEDPPLQRPPVD
jgi:putative transposase